MSHRPDTRPRAETRVEAPPPAPQASQVDLKTLLITAVASAVAAFVVSHIWAPGTLFSAAMTPVIVALIREGIQRPVDRIATVAPVLPRRRMPGDVPTAMQEGAPPPVFAPEPGTEAGPVRIYDTGRRRINVRLAVATGLAGFLICVLAYTVPDLVAGKSVLGGGRSTTLFDGSSRSSRSSSAPATTTTSTQTTTAPATTVTTTVPAQTTTVTTQQATTPTTTTPSPQIAPQDTASQTTPAPQATPPATTTTPTPTPAP
jgi:hypothetical protein